MRLATLLPRQRTSLLAAVLALVLGGLTWVMPGSDTALAAELESWQLALVITGAFAVGERLTFHIESQNEAVSFTPSDIPLAIGLLVLSPPALVAARVVGGAIGLLIWRRQPLFKLLFNLTSFSAEVVVGSLLLRLVLGTAPTPSLVMWVTLLAVVFGALVLGSLLIAVAISFFENDLVARLRKEIGHAYVFHLPGAVLGASAAVPILVQPWLVILFIVPAPLVWAVLRAHGSLMHRFTDLRHVHEFSSQVGRSTHVQDIAETAVLEIATNLRASSVALATWSDRGVITVTAQTGDDSLADILLQEWGPDGALQPTAPVIISRSGERVGALAEVSFEEIVVLPLVDGDRVIGALAAADRVGAVDFFSEDDLERLASMAPQLSVALRKGQLHVQIQHEATHDQLTGLPNRGYFEAWMAESLSASEQVAVMLIDLDRFKEVNDTFGHHVGDELLIEASARISSNLAESDVAFRLGGDEFAIVSPDSGNDEACLLAMGINQALEQPFDLDGTTLAISASIGISLAPLHGADRDTLIKRADMAMYDAKRRHARAVVFSADLEGSDTSRLALLSDLRNAVRDGDLHVHYQPQIDLATGELIGVEALCRWTHPDHGPVGPDVFIALAEQAGLIEDLTTLVLRRALTDGASWFAKGRGVHVAVNLSPQSLMQEDLPDQVASLLRECAFPASLLTLELTEGSVMVDTPRTRRNLERLDRLGVRLSVDDFGTGYSSLVNLRRLPVRELKIDRGFVSDLLGQPDDEIIVRSTIDLAHNLGLVVVAEGVEDDETLLALRTMGCDIGQGFGISRPLSAEAIGAWMDERLVARLPGSSEMDASLEPKAS